MAWLARAMVAAPSTLGVAQPMNTAAMKVATTAPAAARRGLAKALRMRILLLEVRQRCTRHRPLAWPGFARPARRPQRQLLFGKRALDHEVARCRGVAFLE